MRVINTLVVPDLPPLLLILSSPPRWMFFVAWFWPISTAPVSAADVHKITRAAVRRVMAAKGIECSTPGILSAQHPHPAHLRHDGDLGPSRASGERPARAHGFILTSRWIGIHHLLFRPSEYSRPAVQFKRPRLGATFFSWPPDSTAAHVIIGSTFLTSACSALISDTLHAHPALSLGSAAGVARRRRVVFLVSCITCGVRAS